MQRVKKGIAIIVTMMLLSSYLFLTDRNIAEASMVYLQDDFQDGNFTSPAWTTSGGTWAVATDAANASNKVLNQTHTSQEAYITAGNSSWGDYTYQMKVRHGDGGAFVGLIARYQDANNYYMFRMNPVSTSTLELSKKVGGTSTLLGSKTDFTMSSGTWYTLKVEVSGGKIKCFVNDSLIFDTVDTALASGKVGIRSNWGTFQADEATVTTNNLGVAATLFLLKNETAVSNAKVQWTPVTGATRYDVTRSVNNGAYAALQSVTGTSLDDYGLTVGSSYKYQVKAYAGTTQLASAESIAYVPYTLPAGLTTFDNTQASTLKTPNELKVGNTYYRFNFVGKAEGGFGQMIQQTSTDDINYGNDQVVLSYTDHADLNNCKFEGISIVYHAPTNKFVFWAHYENSTDYTLGRVSVASATPGQSFTFHKSFRPAGNDSRDLSLFRDDDGSAYLISTANTNTDTILYKLTSNWLDVDYQVSVIYDNMHRELPSMIKKDGIYYLFSSQAAGWYPSQPMYSAATQIGGSWSELRTVGNTSTFSAQSGGVVRVKQNGGANYVMVAFRWMFGWAGVVNGQTEQRLMPISFSNGFAFYDYFDQVMYNAANDIVVPVQNGKLLSQGKISTAQSVLASGPASYANDGNYLTEWVGTSVAWPHWWKVDLGSVQSIRNVQISWWMLKGSEGFYQYKIETSTDNVNWTVAADRTGNTSYGFTSDTLAASARYVRINMVNADLHNNPGNWYTPRLFEVKVFGNDSGAVTAASRWQSHNYPTRYVANDAGTAKIVENPTLANSEWNMVPGLADPTGVSFQLKSNPALYLRHSSYVLYAQTNSGGTFAADATFYRVPGLADSSKFSFQSYNYPTRYIRHSGFNLRIDPISTAAEQGDATFAAQ
ncbi:AbfB domain-containing protein [Paenibacillus sp. YIM B09110]|uniref:AbfB domain-containing protein n=1 Tax=Paenibacillus sp. YIM B09110 TaxID=3126102 RepID=UPI00301C6E6D